MCGQLKTLPMRQEMNTECIKGNKELNQMVLERDHETIIQIGF